MIFDDKQKRKYKKRTKEEIEEGAQSVTNLAQLLKYFHLKATGGNYINMKRLLQKYNIDTSHWTGCGWNKDEMLKDWSQYTKIDNLKKHLINLRGNRCEYCGLGLWLTQPITLEVHHKDGNRTNNDPSNLILLCPNCHSYTNNWRKSILNKQ